MEISNEFTVPVSVDEAWGLLTDLEKIAPCLPGATLTGVDGDDYKGRVRIKVGPITANYSGVARFESRDDEAKVAVLKAEGRETKGQGNASAVVTARLFPEEEGTRVQVDVDLTIAGRVAQFGRGVLAEISTKLMGDFATALAAMISGGGAAEVEGAEPGATDSTTTGDRVFTEAAEDSSPAEGEIDAFKVLAKPIAKRLAPLFALGVVIAILLRRRGRKR